MGRQEQIERIQKILDRTEELTFYPKRNLRYAEELVDQGIGSKERFEIKIPFHEGSLNDHIEPKDYKEEDEDTE